MSRFRYHSMGVLLTAAYCLGSAQPVFAQDDAKIKLELKSFYPDAKPFYQVVEIKNTQAITVMGEKMNQEQTEVLTIRWTPQPRKGENLVVKQQIVRIKSAIKIGENKITSDSSRAIQDSLEGALKPLTEAELTLVIDPAKMTVVETLGRKESIAKLNKAHPLMGSIIDVILGEDGLMQRAEQLLIPLPASSVGKKATWKKTNPVRMSLGTWENSDEYTYEGMENERDKISIKPKSTWKIQRANGAFQIKGATLTSETGSGHIIFDRMKGRVDSSVRAIKMNGTVEMIIGKNQIRAELRQMDEEIRMTTLDTIPELSSKK